MQIGRFACDRLRRTVNACKVKVMVTHEDLLREAAAQMRQGGSNQGSIFRWRGVESGEGVFVERESPAKMTKHWRGIRPHDVEQKTPRLFDQFPCWPAFPQCHAHRWRVEGRLLRSVKFLFLPPEHDPDSFVRELGATAFQRRTASEISPLPYRTLV